MEGTDQSLWDPNSINPLLCASDTVKGITEVEGVTYLGFI